jgi:hypothetical protein
MNLGAMLLVIVALALYSPVFYTTYAYTDQWVMLWHYGKDDSFHMFLGQGRYVTDKLFYWLFGKASTVADISYIRSLALTG